ncbi:MAG: ABC transporter substrate-binding protein [Dehalococcoidia bacterium]|nr:ABC transporter substrate-binding protein [Dehalococcoidia bacterium]
MSPDFTATHVYVDPMFDYMLGVDKKGRLDATRGFVTSWNTNQDSTVWTLKVREDVVFHNGDRASAKDIKGTVDYGTRPGSRSSAANTTRSAIGSIDSPDLTTSVVTLKSSRIFFPIEFLSPLDSQTVSYLMPTDYLQKVGDAAYARSPVGSGPYKLNTNVIGDKVVYEALPKHWYYGVPKFAVLEFRSIPETATRVALLRNGDADIARIGEQQVAQVKANGLNIQNKSGSQIASVFLYQQWQETNPLSNIKVRQALSLAVDRQTIVDTFLAGQGVPTVNYPLQVKDQAFVRLPAPKQDLAKARQLLAESGLGKITLNMHIVNTGIESSTEIMEAIAVEWEKIGITVKRIPVQLAAFTAEWVAEKLPNPSVAGPYTASTRPVGSRLVVGLAGADPTIRTANGLSRDPDFVPLVKAILGATTVETYNTNFRALQQTVTDKAVYIPLFEAGTLFASRPQTVPADWNPGFSVFGHNVLGVIDPKP